MTQTTLMKIQLQQRLRHYNDMSAKEGRRLVEMETTDILPYTENQIAQCMAKIDVYAEAIKEIEKRIEEI